MYIIANYLQKQVFTRHESRSYYYDYHPLQIRNHQEYTAKRMGRCHYALIRTMHSLAKFHNSKKIYHRTHVISWRLCDKFLILSYAIHNKLPIMHLRYIKHHQTCHSKITHNPLQVICCRNHHATIFSPPPHPQVLQLLVL